MRPLDADALQKMFERRIIVFSQKDNKLLVGKNGKWVNALDELPTIETQKSQVNIALNHLNDNNVKNITANPIYEDVEINGEKVQRIKGWHYEIDTEE